MGDSAALIRAELDQATAQNVNFTALRTVIAPPWVSSQNYRSTSDILWSCILTLTACVYTVLHLNVSSTKPKLLDNLKLKWVTTTLFAPELVLFLACFQYLEATWLMKELNRLQRQSMSCRKDFVFDMRYAFFVVMGGLQISYEDIATDWSMFKGSPEEKPPPPRPSWKPWTEKGQQTDEFLYNQWAEAARQWEENHVCQWSARPYTHQAFNDSKPTRRLSSRGVLDLAKLDHFIYIPRETIEDKSKQDTIQKALVVIQVTWMFLQCIVRKHYGLPLSLLEVHTVIHVGCAIMLYCLWFKKPLDVKTPEQLSHSLPKDLQALLLYESIVDSSQYLTVLCPVISGECPQLHSMNEDGTISIKTTPDGQPILRPTLTLDNDILYKDKILLEPGDTLPCGVRFISRQGGPADPIWLSAQDCALLERVVSAVKEIDGIPILVPQVFANRIARNRTNEDSVDTNEKLPAKPPTELSASSFQSLSNFVQPELFLQILTSRRTAMVLLLLLPATYGGLHLTGWSAVFPTPAEQFLWKFSAFTIIGGCPIFYALAYGFGTWLEKSKGENFTFEVLMVSLLCIMMFTYIGARVFIVVEAFIGLRGVPIGVYWSPDWVEMLPHV